MAFYLSQVECKTNPIFTFLRRYLPEAEGGGGGHAAGHQLTWNFNKFIVDKYVLVLSFTSRVLATPPCSLQ